MCRVKRYAVLGSRKLSSDLQEKKKYVIQNLQNSVHLAFFSMAYNLGNQAGHGSCVKVIVFCLGWHSPHSIL